MYLKKMLLKSAKPDAYFSQNYARAENQMLGTMHGNPLTNSFS